VTASTREEVAPGRKNGGNDGSWADTNLIGSKIKKNHAVDLAAINGR
jgi:hypothetical protein